MAEKCERCGAPLNAYATPGLCPSCLLRGGLLADVQEVTPTSQEFEGCAFEDGGVFQPPMEAITRQFGEYELLEKIAQGGMGVVYKARQTSLNRIVALKMILAGRLASLDAVDRFRREAEAAARLEHPNIVPIHEIGQHAGSQYFTMRYVEGGNLLQTCGSKPWPMVRAAEVMLALARAMDYAHRRGVLHRDLKPANILLDSSGQPQITDFGLAKLVTEDTGLTRSAVVMGTPNYMAPEQAVGQSKQATAAADIYSLGAILYHLLTGLPPFEGDSEMDILRRVVTDEPRRPRALVPKLDRGLETICLKCLEKASHRRYATAEELACDLERWLRHEPITARPSTPVGRVVKWARRRPMQATLAAVITLAVLIVALLWSKAERERTRGTVASSQNAMKEVEGLFAKGLSGAALAQLAHLVRTEGVGRVAGNRMLAALSQRCFAVPAGELAHDDEILDAEYSADGRWVLTASRDRTAAIWTSQTGRLFRRLAGHQGEVRCARFSPDSQRVITGSEDRSARLWDVASGLSFAEFGGHESAVRSVQFAPDGQRCLTLAGKVVRVWEIASKQLALRFVAGQETIRTARFSPDGERIVTASQDGLVQVWDARQGRAVGAALRHDGAIHSAEFSPDAHWVLSASDDGTARIWPLSPGDPITLRHEGPVASAHFSPDGQRVVTASLDQTVRLWDTRNGAQVAVMLHEKQVNAALFSADGLRILSVSDDGTSRLWDAETGKALAEPIACGSFLEGGAIRPDGGQVVVWSSSSRARLWDSPGLVPLVKPVPRDTSIHWVEFSPDGASAVLLSERSLELWDVQTAKTRGEVQRLEAPIRRAHFHPDGKELLIVSTDVMAVAPVSAMGATALRLRPDGPVHVAEFSPDGRWIVGASSNRALIWEAKTGAATDRVFQHRETVEAAHLSPDSRRLITASRDGTACVWGIRTGRRIVLAHAQPVLAAQFSTDGRKVVTGAADGAVRVWDAATGRLLLGPLQHAPGVNSVAFSPDDQRLVTAAADQTVRVWDVATGLPLTDPLRPEEQVWGARFTSSGCAVVTQSGLVWELPIAPQAVPSWLVELAEAVGGWRWDRGNLVPVSSATFLSLKQRLQASTATDTCTRWAKWFLADPRTRGISPSARLTVPEYVEAQIEANTWASLQEAVRLCPTNTRARSLWAKLPMERN